MRRSILTSLGAVLAATGALAQGSNDCSTAQAITGTGLFAFNNIGATTDGPGGCSVQSDVWYLWTAPATSDFIFRTCSQVSFDSLIAAYSDTACPPTMQIGCSDDACGLQSSFQFSAIMGNQYLLRAGGFGGSQGSGNIEIIQVLSGGANDCANAEVLVGTGTFPWNNAGMTDDGPVACNAHKDVWFEWTAPSTDNYTFSLCGQTSLDTMLALYEGTSCPPTTQIACVDDACGLQSQIVAALTGGTDYLIRIGSFSTSATGAGFLDVDIDPCSVSANDDSLEDNDSCSTPVAVPEGSTPGLWAAKSDSDWYSVNVQPGGTITLDVLFTHANGDIDIALWDSTCINVLASSTGIVDNEQIVFNNATGNRVSYNLNVYVYSGSTSNCNAYDLVVTGSGSGLGTKYCSANPNSTGLPADLSASGSTSSAAGDLVLQSAPVPNNFGIFYHGANQAQLPFGNGFQCAVDDIVRGAVVLASGNIAGYVYDNSDPLHLLDDYIGSTRNFQHWYRDPTGGGAFFNLSNAMSITIVP